MNKSEPTVAKKNSLKERGRNLKRNQVSKGGPIILGLTQDSKTTQETIRIIS